MNRSLWAAIGAAVCCLFTTVASAQGEEPATFSAEEIEFFEAKVRPLLAKHCYACHSTDAGEKGKLKAGLFLDTRAGHLQGGETGAAVVPGKPEDSLLIEAVKYESYEMPPDGKLSEPEIAVLVEWVRRGAPWPKEAETKPLPREAAEYDWETLRADHWAWRPVVPPEPPAVTHTAWVRSPIDRFVAAQLESQGLSPGTDAEPAVLLRRLSIDLTGLPPSPEDVDAFEREMEADADAAVARWVERLLSSPAYGERWGRHWLDVARYSDGYGGFLDSSGLENAWRYRDWVVQAFNDDLPYDEFLRRQLCGDLPEGGGEAVATGFLALGPTYRSDGGDPDSVAQARGETLDDRMDTFGRGVLGLTVACARCHDHKFDPIPQQDYYSLAGVFNNTQVREAPLVPAEVVQAYDDHQRRIRETQQQINTLNGQIKKEQRKATEEEQTQLDGWQAALQELQQTAPAKYPFAHALADTGTADMAVALRGNLRKPGEVAPRRFLRILSPAEPAPFARGSGRLDLAEAVTSPDNPLTARVFVNRVWLQHFGQGLVRTPSNFGTLGQPPTHPELLDWLAAGFIESGWSIKQLHRTIVLSSTYRQSSRFRDDAYRIDGDNKLLWRMNPRRMKVEAWRDSLLAVTGELDTEQGGPPVENILGSRRRTLYAKVSRNGDRFASDEFLRLFDFPLMRATVAQRPVSIVPQQFLFLMNSPFMVERARALTARLQRERNNDADRIVRAYRLLYGREPTAAETTIGQEFLSEPVAPGEGDLSRWDQYAQTLLSANEFMFVR